VSRRVDWSIADSVFQSATPSILETISRLSLWLTGTALEARYSRRVCAIVLASRKSRIVESFAVSEPGVPGGCVADPVARGKGKPIKGSIRSPFP
jgi:hypothetical protein